MSICFANQGALYLTLNGITITPTSEYSMVFVLVFLIVEIKTGFLDIK
jgi:hypothetical protein